MSKRGKDSQDGLRTLTHTGTSVVATEKKDEVLSDIVKCVRAMVPVEVEGQICRSICIRKL